MAAPKRSLAGIAGLVGLATILSKLIGLLREQVIAATFGVSGLVDAYNYAYKLPGFLLILLGGVNGPFHSAVVSVVARQDRKKTSELMENINTLVGVALGVVSILLWWGAPLLIGLVAQGATAEVQQLAVGQLRIMAPVALFAGLIGLGFGVLTAADRYALPSLSPIFSSGAVILAVWLFAPQYGASVLAWGVLVGALLQWLVQIPLQWRLGLGTLRLRWQWNTPEVQSVLKIMTPATISSVLSNLNVYTDLFFASQLATGVASALNFANFLVQTPLGILSNVLLIPALPIYSRLAASGDRVELRLRIRQGVLTVMVIVLPISALAVALSLPLVTVIYQRGAFNSEAAQLVAQVFGGAAVGMVFYLTRDLLIRVFYALGEAQIPLRISIVGIGMNLFLDWLLIKFYGAAGLTLATTGVSAVACGLLVWGLHQRLGGLSWRGLPGTALLLTLGAGLTGVTARLSYDFFTQFWPTLGTFPVLLKFSLAGLLGVGVQALWLNLWQIREINDLLRPLGQRLLRRKHAA